MEESITLLEETWAELKRLQNLLLPRYEGKLVEPNPRLIKKVEKFLYPNTP